MKHHPHETTVSALFPNAVTAREALKALDALPMDPQDVSLLTSPQAYEKEVLVELIAGDKVHEEAIHAGKIGGVTGAVLAALTTVAGIAMSGGSLLAAGPLIAVTAGAGGLLGTLLGAGFSDMEAEKIDRAIQEGHVMVVVHATDKKLAHSAEDLMKGHGAEETHLH